MGQLVEGENPFIEEAYQRVAVDHLIRVAGIEYDDVLIMSDVDEIPSAYTINLLRWCDGPPPIGKTRYVHYRQSDYLLADSGWHCSFCFRKISDFVFKMKAYSHASRVRFTHYLDPKRIQKVICNSANLFDMLPEEYTYRELIGKMGPIPHLYSALHVPWCLLNNAEKYKYLLPENCIREDG
ncbi:Glycosyl transferase, family 17 [Artemisia annua]|uniref:Glycosyl transferase, family 17 n=1 Tax=Artemisia annua TaxID=35608 RepID=A0A2U1KN63_ARTAN|nr:Glycosyl transferase, family 17 [Artemisia annua]